MSVRTFINGSIPHGDAGRMVRGVTIKCSRCPATHSTPMNTIHNSKPRDQEIVVARIATRKFEGDGWKVGHNHKHDLCPACRQKPQQQPKSPTPTETKAVKTAPAPTKSPSEQPPRVMGIDDALTIARRLQDIYLGKEKGYADDWTDGKLAESLGVPRAWVKECRVKTFGDGLAGNDEIAALVRDAQAVRNDALGILEKLGLARKAVLELIDEAESKLRARLDVIDRNLGAVARTAA